jgi:hypothetical protein
MDLRRRDVLPQIQNAKAGVRSYPHVRNAVIRIFAAQRVERRFPDPANANPLSIRGMSGKSTEQIPPDKNKHRGTVTV